MNEAVNEHCRALHEQYQACQHRSRESIRHSVSVSILVCMDTYPKAAYLDLDPRIWTLGERGGHNMRPYWSTTSTSYVLEGFGG